MPSIIKVKRSGTAGVVPSSLSAGELAANTADSVIYVGTGSGVTAIRPRVSATDRVLGRSSAGAGPAEEITCTSQGRSIIAAADAAAQRSVLALGAMATSSGVTLTGDVTGSGTGSFAATLSNSGVTAGTYRSVTVDAKGRVTAGTNPTTLAGYGITDAVTSGGSGASGTWGISISGSAAQLGGVAAGNYFRVDGSYPNADMNVPVEGYWHVASNAANLPDGALYGHRWDYDHAGDGNWVAQFYTPTSGDAGLWFRQRRSGTWQAWRKIVDSSTVNSYAPTLTGGGASGTWGINVSGELTGTSIGLGYSLSTATVSYAGHAGPQIRSQGGGAAVMSFHRPGAYAVNFGLDTDNQLKVGGWSLGANSYVILSSANYNSYAPTRTGGGASGTWGINITGTASSETLSTVCSRGASTSSNITTTGAVYSSNFFRSNGNSGWYSETYGGGIWMTDSTYIRVYGDKQFYTGGAITSGAAMYAPIYYDSQNAAYYCDPNGTSRLASMNIDSLQVFGEYLYVGKSDTATFSTIAMRDSNEGERILHCNSNRIGFLTQAGGWGSWCNDDGSWQNDTAMYAPIFIDSNDATFWVNPANAGFYVRGGSGLRVQYSTEDYGYSVYNAEGTATTVRLGAAWGRPGVYNTTSFTVGAETQIDFVIANNVRMSIASDGAITHNSTPGFFVRAWCKFNAATSPVLFNGGNVSSITYRSAAGRYRVNFTTSIPHTTAYLGNVSNSADTFTNTTMRMGTRNVVSGRATWQDINIVVAGGQGVPAASDAMGDCSFIAVS
jgi:phage-related tail fiber protein